MTATEGVTPDNPSASDAPERSKRTYVVRIRVTAMRAIPQRMSFAQLLKLANEDV